MTNELNGEAGRPAAWLWHSPRRTVLRLLLFAALTNPGGMAALHAAGGTPPVQPPFTIDVWESDDDLPQNSILAMTQTREGYLWLGTLDGLVRFDGIRFTVFDESNTPGLASSRIVRLFEDGQGALWIGTEIAGVLRVQDGAVTSVGLGRGSRDGRLTGICQDSAGAIWLYTADGQLCRYQEGHTNLFAFNEGRVDSTRALIAEEDGWVWIAAGRRLAAINPQASFQSPELPLEVDLTLPRVDVLLPSSQGGFWLLNASGVQRWKDHRMARHWGSYRWNNVLTPVTTACEDLEGNLIVGTLGAGLFWFDAEGNSVNLSTNQNLPHNSILSLLVDHEGTLWAGTDGGGLFRIKRQVFNVLEPSRALTVQSVCEDAQGGMWIGLHGGPGIGHWKNERLQYFALSARLPIGEMFYNDLPVWAVLVDRQQRVWAGTLARGLFQLTGGVFRQAPGSAALHPQISALFQDRQGHIWVGTRGGLARWDEREWKIFTRQDGLSSDVVHALAEDAEGNLWIGTERGGLNRLRDGQFTVFRKHPDGLPSDDISSLWLDADGVLWVGTFGNGLARFHQGRWTRYSTHEGLASNRIGYLLEDDEDRLWIGSNRGLMQVPKQALNAFDPDETTVVPCRVYGKPDGLPTRECTRGSQPAACRARDGTLWFPTIKGLVSLQPEQLKPNLIPPPVLIESVMIDGQPQKTNQLRMGWPATIVVPARKERLEIQYTSLNLAAPDRARFKYRLEGHETDWVEAGNSRVARYSRLPPGEYRFQVIASNEDGVWNSTGSSLALVVQPPFWRTWWFLSASIATVLGLVAASVYYASTQRLQRQLARLKQEEALEKERSRIARDIHDQLGANLTQVGFLGEMIEGDKHDPDEVELHARQITQTARDTARALDEIVWAANPSNDTLEGLVNYTCKYAQEYLTLAGLRYRLDVPPALPDVGVPPDVRHNVFLAVKEAVTNVVRHAHASAVWLRLRLEPGRFVLELEDNGRGMGDLDEAKIRTRNGLTNMRRRMEDIGGNFTIGPAGETGTRVQLITPIKNIG